MGITEDFDMASRAPDEVLAKAVRDPMSSPISQIAALSALKERQMLRSEMSASMPKGGTVADRALAPQGYARGGIVGFEKGGQVPSRAEIEAHAVAMADKYGVPRDYMLRLIQKESSFNVNARGPLIEKFKGTEDQHAYGPAQLLPSTAKSLGVDYRDWKQNVEGGAKYSRQMYDKFGDWHSAAYAYNAGPGNAQKGRGIAGAREYADFVASGGGGAPQGAAPQGQGQIVDFAALRAMLEGIEAPQIAPQGKRQQMPMPDLEGLMQAYQPAFADTGEDDEMMAAMTKEMNQRKKDFQTTRPEFAGFSQGGPVRKFAGEDGGYVSPRKKKEYEPGDDIPRDILWSSKKYLENVPFEVTDEPLPFRDRLSVGDRPVPFNTPYFPATDSPVGFNTPSFPATDRPTPFRAPLQVTDSPVGFSTPDFPVRDKPVPFLGPDFPATDKPTPFRGPLPVTDKPSQFLTPRLEITDKPTPFSGPLPVTDKPVPFNTPSLSGGKPRVNAAGQKVKEGLASRNMGTLGRDVAEASSEFWADGAKMAVEGIPSDEIGWAQFNDETPGIVTAGLNVGRAALDATARFGGAMGAVGGMLGTGLGAVYDATLGYGPGTRAWMTAPKDAAGTPEKKKIEVKADGKKPAQPPAATKPTTAQTPVPPTTKVPTTDQAAQDTVTGKGGVMGDLESFVRDLMAEKEAASSRGRSEREQRLRDTAILQAGLGIAAGDSPYFASNLKGAMPAIQMYQAGMDNIDQDVAAREDAYRQALIGARTGDMRMQAAREAAGLETKQRLAVAEFEMKAKLEELRAKGQLTREDFLRVVKDTYLPGQTGMAAAQLPADYKGSLTDFIQMEANRLYNQEQLLTTRRVGVADSQNGSK